MNNKSNYVAWYHRKADGIAKLGEISGATDLHELSDGISRAKAWPTDVSVAMDKNFKKDLGLGDALAGQCLAVSARLKAATEAESPGNVEFLPISVLNHKGRVASDEYFIMNPLDVIDCFDPMASAAKSNPITPTKYLPPRKIVLREDAIPNSIKLFRLLGLTSVVIARRDLAEAIMAQNMTGLYMIELDKFN